MNGIHEVTGSIPVWSTNLRSPAILRELQLASQLSGEGCPPKLRISEGGRPTVQVSQTTQHSLALQCWLAFLAVTVDASLDSQGFRRQRNCPLVLHAWSPLLRLYHQKPERPESLLHWRDVACERASQRA